MARLSTKTPAKKPAVAKAVVANATKSKVAARPAVTAKPVTAKAAAPKKSAASGKRAAGATKTTFTKKERFRMVAEAAYFRAERQGFMGDPVQDWIEAENEISMMLNLS